MQPMRQLAQSSIRRKTHFDGSTNSPSSTQNKQRTATKLNPRRGGLKSVIAGLFVGIRGLDISPKYQLTNAFGQEVISGIFNLESNSINFERLKKGLYFLKIEGQCFFIWN
jgi:hypothetical protein